MEGRDRNEDGGRGGIGMRVEGEVGRGGIGMRMEGVEG